MKMFIATLPCWRREAFHGILCHAYLALRLSTRLGMRNAVVLALTSFTGWCDHWCTSKDASADFRSCFGIVCNGLNNAVMVTLLQFLFPRQYSPGDASHHRVVVLAVPRKGEVLCTITAESCATVKTPELSPHHLSHVSHTHTPSSKYTVEQYSVLPAT